MFHIWQFPHLEDDRPRKVNNGDSSLNSAARQTIPPHGTTTLIDITQAETSMTFGSQATLFLDALSERRSESSYSLDLPTPSPLSPRLLRLGLDAKTAEAVSAAYFRGASDLKRKFEFEYASTCRALDATAGSKEFTKEFLPKLRATLVSKYCNALSGLVTQAAEKAKLHVSKIKKSFTQAGFCPDFTAR